ALQFTPADSGENGFHVVYQAAAGQTPRLSGAVRVSGFSLYDSAKHIYRAAVPAGTQSRQLFVNGVRAVRARGPQNPSFSASGASFTTSDKSYLSFTRPNKVEIVYDHAWKQM